MVSVARRLVLPPVLTIFLLFTPKVFGDQDLTIEGRVTADGEGLPDAVIRLLRLGPADDSSPATARLPLPVRSDARGRFVVTVPTFGLWRLRVEAPGRLAQEIVAEPRDNPIRLPPVDLPAAVEIAVQVSDEDGRPVTARLAASSAVPTARRGPEPGWLPASTVVTTDRDGRARVTGSADGNSRLWVQADGLAPLTVDVAATVSATGPRDRLELQIERGVPRPLTVTDPRGHPLAGVRLHFAEELPPLAVTDVRGRATVAAPSDCALDLVLVAPDGGALRWTLPPADEEAPAPVTVHVATALRIRGRVVQAGSSQPLPGAAVWLPLDATVKRAIPVPSALTDADGVFELALAPPLPARLAAAALDHVSVVADLGEVAGAGPEIALPPLRLGIGQVLADDEKPVADAEVRLLPRAADSDPIVPLVAHTDTGGRFALPNPPPGRHDLEVRATGFAPVRVPGIEVPDRRGETDLGVVVLAEGARFEGRVVDSDGLPLEGAEILLAAEGLAPTRADVLMAEDPQGAVTDSDGGFAFRDLAAGRFHLQARKAGYLSTELADVAIPTAEPLEIVLRSASAISGWVLDSKGQGVAGALVSVEPAGPAAEGEPPALPGSDPGLHGISGDRGRFTIPAAPPGRLRLTARAGGFLDTVLPELELPPGESLDGLEITLRRGAVVTGIVRDPIGQPVPDVLVSVEPSAFTRTDREGRFELVGLEPGLQSVVAADDAGRRAERRVPVGTGSTELELTLEGGTEVTGRVRSPDGEPVPTASVTLLDPAMLRPSLETRTDASGRFVLSAVPRGSYQILVQRQGFVPSFPPEPLQVETAPIRGLELEIDRGAVIRGRISGVSLEELPGAMVRVAGLAMAHSRLDYEGRFVLTGLPAAELSLEILVPGHRPLSRRVRVPEGGSEISVELALGDELRD